MLLSPGGTYVHGTSGGTIVYASSALIKGHLPIEVRSRRGGSGPIYDVIVTV